jgi:hypothetical protein
LAFVSAYACFFHAAPQIPFGIPEEFEDLRELHLQLDKRFRKLPENRLFASIIHPVETGKIHPWVIQEFFLRNHIIEPLLF